MPVMQQPEDLLVDDLQEGRQVPFAPDSVGIRHSDFGLIDGYVVFVERSGDVLVAELSDGRRFEVSYRGVTNPPYSLFKIGD